MIMRNISIILLILCVSALLAVEKQQLARLHYDGGGDWYNDSDTLPNLVQYLNENIHTVFSLEQAVVRPDDAELNNYPVMKMNG